MYDNGLPSSEKARWIVLSNFAEVWVYDMDTRRPEESVVKFGLDSLAKDYKKLDFLYDSQVERVHKEFEISQIRTFSQVRKVVEQYRFCIIM